MATKSSKAPEASAEAPVVVADDRKLLPGFTPGTVTDDGYYVPSGTTRRIECPLFPGLKLTFLYLPSVAFAFTRDDYWLPGVDSPLENACRKMAMYVRGAEGWKFKSVTGDIIPPPDPADWQTYIPICAIRGEL